MKEGLRLTGGTARGARLFSVEGRDVRPALARMRISVFEILRPRLDGARVADLFAGNGTLGLEALSRGAAHCAFFDIDPRCIEAIRRNVEKLRMADRAEVAPASAFDAPRRLADGVDIVFVDPPYAFYDDPEVASRIEAAVKGITGDPIVVVEHRSVQDLGDGWAGKRRYDRRRYGGTHVSFYRRA
jgi:16S rRNA (guanine966-N2)-methyltransferase